MIKKPDLTKYKAILFDMDGVLIDAAEWHEEALNDALAVFGFNISHQDHETVFNGLPTREKLKMLSKERGLPEALHAAINAAKQANLAKHILAKCRPDYQKIALLKHLSKTHSLGCCSNAVHASIQTMLKKAGIDSYFRVFIGNDDTGVRGKVLQNKPAPDIYHEAMSRLMVKPQECLIVEDSIHGQRSAKASGADVVIVNSYQQVNLTLLT